MTDPAQITARDPAAARPATEPGRRRTAAPPVTRRPPACGRQTARTARSAPSPGDPILASKITVPGVPDWAVPRPQVTGLIAQGIGGCPLTVVTGPPGAGKTMALALWAAAEPGPVAWVSLDEYDNRPGVFWSYVVAALRRSGVTVPRAVRPPAGAGGPITCSCCGWRRRSPPRTRR